jgi:hypothetical protein
LKKPISFRREKDFNPTNKWSLDEIEYLKNNYFSTPNINLSKKLNRTVNGVIKQSVKLNLNKDPKIKSDFMINRNKEMGRDLTFDLLKNIALKYRTRGEFQSKDGSAYQTVIRSGVLKDICNHMIDCNYSTPQLILYKILKTIIDPNCLYNYRKVIYPYEIDIYSDKFKLGFEYNGKIWHREDTNSFIRDTIKNEKCKEKGITLITIIENNKDYENDIKNQLIDNLNLINNVSNLYITKENILDVKIDYDSLLHDKRNIKDICLKYDDYSIFKKEQPTIFHRLKNNKLLDEYTSHMNKKVIWDEESLKKEISKYKFLSDFTKKSKGAYLHIIRHNMKHLLLPLEKKRLESMTDEQILDIINNYEYYSDFKKEQPRIYSLIKNSKKWYLISKLKREFKENLILRFSSYIKLN